MTIRPGRAGLFHVDGQTDRRTDRHDEANCGFLAILQTILKTQHFGDRIGPSPLQRVTVERLHGLRIWAYISRNGQRQPLILLRILFRKLPNMNHCLLQKMPKRSLNFAYGAQLSTCQTYFF